MRSKEQIQQTLLSWMSKEDSSWTIWYGADENNTTQLLNKDGSNPYTRQENVSPEIMAYDPNIKVTTEIYRITSVLEDSLEPDANTSWWLSIDNGTTKIKTEFVKKESRAKRTHWHIYLKNG